MKKEDSKIEIVRRARRRYKTIMRKWPPDIGMNKEFYDELLKEVEETMPEILPAVRDKKLIFGTQIKVID